MLSDRIKTQLEQTPHWGPKRLAEHLKTSPRTITTTACRNGIRFMDRRAVEDYVDQLRARLDGQA